MLDCSNCKKSCKTVIVVEGKGLRCEYCHERKEFYHDASLHETGPDGLTKGKRWEMENRIISRDDRKTVINKVTGKPAQY